MNDQDRSLLVLRVGDDESRHIIVVAASREWKDPAMWISCIDLLICDRNHVLVERIPRVRELHVLEILREHKASCTGFSGDIVVFEHRTRVYGFLVRSFGGTGVPVGGSGGCCFVAR